MRFRCISAAVATALCLFFLGGCSRPAGGPEKNRVRFRLDWTPGSEHSFIYYAIDHGFYSRAGLDVEVVPGEGSSVSAKLVAAGDNDFALCSGDSALLGRTQGLPIVVVAVLYPRTPASIYSLKQKNIVKPTDLYGKRYGATYKSTTYQQFIAFTNAAGLDRSRIQIVPSPGKAEELMAGTIDAQGGYTYLQPVQLEVAGQSINEILLADYGVQIYSMSIIANDQTLAKRRALAAAFVKATLQGFQQMIADPPAAFSSFLKYNRGANKAVEEAKLRKLATFLARDQPPKLGWQTEDGWRKTQETLLLLKIIEKGIDVRRVFTTDLLP